MIGWNKHGDRYVRTFFALDGSQHVIVVARIQSGWSLVWQRGPGFTVHEASGFLTLEECVAELWRVIFERMEEYMRLKREEAIRIVRGEKQ